MSLDVHLYLEGHTTKADTEPRIFIRENGQTKQISREAWDERYPGREPVAVMPTDADEETTRVYHDNITHNLNTMAKEAGLYEPLWRPEEINVTQAAALLPLLREGLLRLMESPQHFAQCNPENGWGTYDGLLTFVRGYIVACVLYPDARVSVSR